MPWWIFLLLNRLEIIVEICTKDFETLRRINCNFIKTPGTYLVMLDACQRRIEGNIRQYFLRISSVWWNQMLISRLWMDHQRKERWSVIHEPSSSWPSWLSSLILASDWSHTPDAGLSLVTISHDSLSIWGHQATRQQDSWVERNIFVRYFNISDSERNV